MLSIAINDSNDKSFAEQFRFVCKVLSYIFDPIKSFRLKLFDILTLKL